MPEPGTDSPTGECYRCGYDLRGIADEQPCPECGLLAERSRRFTDELHDTRPRWLRSLFWGASFILLAILVACAWSELAPWMNLPLVDWLYQEFPVWSIPIFYLLGFMVAAGFSFIGIILLTRPEGYLPADLADWRLRLSLRILAFVPIVSLGLDLIDCESEFVSGRYSVFGSRFSVDFWQSRGLVLFMLALIPLPLLLFLRLRGLALRARSAHLAEHCTIVGIGASATVLYSGAVLIIVAHAREWDLDLWMDRSPVSLAMLLITSTAGSLFMLWSLYLFVRFTVAFGRAARQLRHKWERSDRSIQLTETTPSTCTPPPPG